MGLEVVGLDSLGRFGSEINRVSLKRLGVRLFQGDIRNASDLETPAVDWVIDAAAQPSVLAGRDGKTSTRQLIEHNLLGTMNLLDYCRSAGAGFGLLRYNSSVFDPGACQVAVAAQEFPFTNRMTLQCGQSK